MPTKPRQQLPGIANVDTDQCVVRTRLRAGRSRQLVDAKVALSRTADGLPIVVEKECAGTVANINHLDVIVGTGVGAGRAADAGTVIDNNRPRPFLTVDRARRTANQADWVSTVHTCVDDHRVVMREAVPRESGVIVVRRGAGPDAVIAADAPIEVDYHRFLAINEAMIDEE